MCMCFFRVVSFSFSQLEISMSYQYGLSTLLVETSFDNIICLDKFSAILVLLLSSQNQKHPFFSHVFQQSGVLVEK